MLLDLYYGNSICRWKVLDFAELKRSSISFFDIEKPETAVSRWARARTRAAKVSAILKLCELYFFDRYFSIYDGSEFICCTSFVGGKGFV